MSSAWQSAIVQVRHPQVVEPSANFGTQARLARSCTAELPRRGAMRRSRAGVAPVVYLCLVLLSACAAQQAAAQQQQQQPAGGAGNGDAAAAAKAAPKQDPSKAAGAGTQPKRTTTADQAQGGKAADPGAGAAAKRSDAAPGEPKTAAGGAAKAQPDAQAAIEQPQAAQTAGGQSKAAAAAQANAADRKRRANAKAVVLTRAQRAVRCCVSNLPRASWSFVPNINVAAAAPLLPCIVHAVVRYEGRVPDETPLRVKALLHSREDLAHGSRLAESRSQIDSKPEAMTIAHSRGEGEAESGAQGARQGPRREGVEGEGRDGQGRGRRRAAAAGRTEGALA